MIWVDYAILSIIGISALISIVRGFVREALSLIGWIVAFWVSLTFSDEVAAALAGKISVPSLRVAAAFLGLLLACLLAAGIINFLVGKLIDKTGLSGTDRMLGMIFGIVRGAVIVGALVLLAGLTALPRDAWWRESMLLKHFQAMAVEVKGLLPSALASSINY